MLCITEQLRWMQKERNEMKWCSKHIAYDIISKRCVGNY